MLIAGTPFRCDRLVRRERIARLGVVLRLIVSVLVVGVLFLLRCVLRIGG